MTGADRVAAQPITLRLTMQVSTNNPLGRNVMDYKQAVETAAGGTLPLDVRFLHNPRAQVDRLVESFTNLVLLPALPLRVHVYC